MAAKAKKKPKTIAKKPKAAKKKASSKVTRKAKPAAKPAAKSARAKARPARKVAAAAPRYGTVTPVLNIEGAGEAIDFFKAAFGATERIRMPRPDGQLMPAQLLIGASVVT